MHDEVNALYKHHGAQQVQRPTGPIQSVVFGPLGLIWLVVPAHNARSQKGAGR